MPKRQAKKTRSNKELLIHWALVRQNQQLWIAQIITSLGCPLLPGHTNQILQKLSAKDIEAWLEEGAPLEFVAGLLAAFIEEKTVRREIGGRLTGEVVAKLLDTRAGQIPKGDNLEENVKTIQSIFKIERTQDKRHGATAQDHQEVQSDAYADAWEELYKQTEQILTEPWSLPATDNNFEAALFARWQEDVLPALKRLGVGLPILVNPEAVNHIPARVKMDRIDRTRHQGVDAMSKSKYLGLLESDEDFWQRHADGEKSAEDTASEYEALEILSQQVNEAVAQVTTHDTPTMREAVKFVLRGGGLQNEASEKYDVPKSTLNDRIIEARERVIKIRQSGNRRE
jgi:hypothetical protein